MLDQITSVLSDENTNIRSLEAKTETEADGALVEMTVDVRDVERLQNDMTTVTDPEHIAISKSKGIKIDWKDRHASDYRSAICAISAPAPPVTGAHGTPPRQPEAAVDPGSPFQIG